MLVYNPNSIEELARLEWASSLSEVFYKQVIIETSYKIKDDIAKNIMKTMGFTVNSINHSSIIFQTEYLFVQLHIGNNDTKVHIWYAHTHYLDEFLNKLKVKYNIVEGYIKWIYDSYNSDIIVPLDNETAPIKEMYPFLGDRSIEEYYESYLTSRSSILLLIGPPGTGKTTFIKGLIKYSKEVARVCYDDFLLGKDGIFSDFIDSSDTFFILEDADSFLAPRKDGNTMMHKFLNVSDGLVKTANKKVIFSTNIPSLKDVDQALIRPGRCFDTLKFDLLDTEQAKKLVKATGSKFVIEEGKKYSAAEIFNSKTNEDKVNRSAGFI